jgi:hypothetical protein
VIGSALGWVLDDRLNWPWQYQLALYLIPTAFYAFMFLGQSFPKSEAAATGVSFAEMYKSVGLLGSLLVCYLLSLFFGDILKGLLPDYANIIGYAIGGALLIATGVMTNFSMGSVVLFVLFVTHALVGSVELGTDSWIQNITGNLFTSEQGKYLFLWTSAIMFGLRFCAHWIENTLKLKPVALLLVCAVIAAIGLYLASEMKTFSMALIALGIYAVGKTFFWPTMLAVVGDRYPKSGAVAMSIMGGIGMLSAGLIGGPGLGYCKDRFAGEELRNYDEALAEKYKAKSPSTFLNIPATAVYGLDGAATEEARKVSKDSRSVEQSKLVTASERGDRRTLLADSLIPATMALIYLGLLVYYKGIGGYRPLRIDEQQV